MAETVEVDNVTIKALTVIVTGLQDAVDNITVVDEVVVARVIADELDVVAVRIQPTSISRSHKLQGQRLGEGYLDLGYRSNGSMR